MLKDITLGQYYPAESKIHSLDVRVKLLAVLCYMVFLFFNNSAAGYGINIAVLAVIIKLTKIPPKQMIKGLRSVLFLLLFSVFFTIFFTKGENKIFSNGIIQISWQGIFLAA